MLSKALTRSQSSLDPHRHQVQRQRRRADVHALRRAGMLKEAAALVTDWRSSTAARSSTHVPADTDWLWQHRQQSKIWCDEPLGIQ